MDNETDLIEAFERVMHQDFQNPQRIGCLGPDALVTFAAHPGDPGFRTFLEHVTQCAPCFNQLKKLRGTQDE